MPHGHLKSQTSGFSLRKLKVGVVGIGYLGKFHVEKYAAIPGVEITGLVDIVPDRAKELAEKVGAKVFHDYHQLLGKVDAVSVVVPTDQHYRVAKDFLLAGSDVLLEKPIASTLGEADDLIVAAKQCGRILQVGHLERFNPAILSVREKIRTPLFIESHRLTPFRDRGTDVDVVLDLMIHDLDIIGSFVRSAVEQIHAVGVPVLTDKVDIASVRMQFVSGCVANITASRISVEDQRRIRIFQPDTYLTVDYAAKKAAVYHRVLDHEGQKVRISMDQVKVEPGDALQTEINSFIHSVLKRKAPVVTGEDGKKALALAMEINEQIQANMEKIPSVASFYEKRKGLMDSSW
ncbi:MAG: Gfo/Idh/MocA family oxidoreductase [Thermodesulfobacteriota bacterium]|nr:Gfo/Idh/MocA family oxidoreductase [Thermodesulfobacteriota bacterium]